MKKGIIFDLDGVIVDTAKYHYLAWRKLANRLGFEFSQKQNELFKGVSRKRCMDILLEMGNVTATQEQKEAWMIEKNDDYLAFIEEMDDSEILPDVPKMLHFLKDNTIPIALGSASKNAKPILEKVGLLSYFDAIVDGNNVTKAKPDPEVFLKAAEAIQIKPENCIVFEDSVAGIQAANKANMISIGIGESSVLNEADVVFSNFTEMSLDFLEKLLTTEKSQLKEI